MPTSSKTSMGAKQKNPRSNQTKNNKLDKRTHVSRTKLMCRHCRAIYDGKSWKPFEKLNPKIIDELKMNICPACHEEANHLSDGVLHLSGSGLSKVKKEIKNLINNTSKREAERDILNRVERIEETKETMVIYTTKNQLAVELGKKIAAAHKGGKIDIKWSKQDKPVEVYWVYEK